MLFNRETKIEIPSSLDEDSSDLHSDKEVNYCLDSEVDEEELVQLVEKVSQEDNRIPKSPLTLSKLNTSLQVVHNLISALLQKYGASLNNKKYDEDKLVYSLALLLRRVEDVMSDTLLIAGEEQKSLLEGASNRSDIYFSIAELSSDLIKSHFVTLSSEEKSKIKKKELSEFVREGLKIVNNLIKEGGVGAKDNRSYYNKYVDYINAWYRAAILLAFTIYTPNCHKDIFIEQITKALIEVKKVVSLNPFIKEITGLDIDERLAIEIQQIDMTSKFYSEVYKKVLTTLIDDIKENESEKEVKEYLLNKQYLNDISEEVSVTINNVCNEVYGVIGEFIEEISSEGPRDA